MRNFTRAELDNLWVRATALPAGSGADPLTKAIITEALEGAGVDVVVVVSATSSDEIIRSLETIRADIEDFIHQIEIAGEG
ncbi:hypothetical protein LCGC14_0294620 [marine sediment metagenome]|uniref:Uncharacterized protein n=1 Tax=marine sediment metagenome TaxID=412755 RepID=A0A0F9TWZ9_9ZZZZ